MHNWKYIIAGFCIPINIIIIFFGIIIIDPFAIMLGSISTGLVLYPILKDYYAKKEKEEFKKKDDKGSTS